MLAGLDGQEANEGNLHASQCSKGIPGRVRHVQPGAVAAHADEDEGVQGQKAGDEGVTSPRGNHVAVEQGAESAPQHGTQLQRLDPEVEGKDQQENGDGLVVVAAGDRPGDVAGGDAHEQGSQETGRRRRGHLIGEEVGGDGGKTRKGGCEEDADIPDIHGNREGSERVVDDAAGDHETGVEGAARDAAQRMPCAVIEPVPEVVEAVRNEVLCGAKVEPRVDWSSVSISTLRRTTPGEKGNGHSWIILSNPAWKKALVSVPRALETSALDD